MASADIGELVRVHRTIWQVLERKEFLYPRSPSFFRHLVDSGGRVVGAFHEGALVGYAALRFPSPNGCAHHRYLRTLGIDRRQLVEGVGGGVLPNFRRHRLFGRLIHERHRLARRLGFRYHSSVVSPGNTHALVTLLAERAFIAALLIDDDGENYLLLKQLRSPNTFASRSGLHAAPREVARNLHLLRQGLCGVPCGDSQDLHLRYFKMRAGDV